MTLSATTRAPQDFPTQACAKAAKHASCRQRAPLAYFACTLSIQKANFAKETAWRCWCVPKSTRWVRNHGGEIQCCRLNFYSCAHGHASCLKRLFQVEGHRVSDQQARNKMNLDHMGRLGLQTSASHRNTQHFHGSVTQMIRQRFIQHLLVLFECSL